MAIQVNTGAVIATADQIDKENSKIQQELDEMEKAVRSLRQYWEGHASGVCLDKYDYVKRSFFDLRFSVIHDLSSFLRNQVGEGYESTEDTILKAAENLK